MYRLTNDNMISGGFYLKARCIQDSEIAHAAPYVREIWDWLLKEANHTDQKWGGRVIKRGQLFRTYNDIREGLSWMVGYRKMMYHENHTKRAMKFLREHLMIVSTKELGGVLITIVNYDKYQNPKNYERTSERTDERTNGEPMANHPIPHINKNDNESNNENTNKGRFTPPSVSEVSDYCLTRNNQINAQSFVDFYTSKGWLIGKSKMKDWKAAIRTWEGKSKTNAIPPDESRKSVDDLRKL